jgi:hypothetical protein
MMKLHKLPDSAIEYLSDHLGRHYSGPALSSCIVTDEDKSGGSSIFFPLSELDLDQESVFFIDEVPVLFPCSESRTWYSNSENGIRFNHDILKSAFYLLSGYQEQLEYEPDQYGRYPWKESIQFRLGFTEKPVVNYYFEIILEALEKHCSENQIQFSRLKPEQPVLFLSHDVDRIKKYSLREFTYVGLQLFKLKPSAGNMAKRWKTFLNYAQGTLLFRPDPFWNFDDLLDIEKTNMIHSTWYFLEKTRENNSRYHFEDPKIRSLIEKIEQLDHEIGIHGTLESSNNENAMVDGIVKLNRVCSVPVSGIRQHYLKYRMDTTPQVQSGAGLTYDTTLGFAERIGFRNSYAFPFRLYDFNKHRGLDLWEVPLIVMDTTLLEYMYTPVESIMEAVEPVLREVMKFHGNFSLLWHNCNLDEGAYPGVSNLYRQLMKHITEKGFISRTGAEITTE